MTELEKSIAYSKHRLGYTIDLDNPQSLSEKVIWRKHFCRNPLMPVTTDKVKAKHYLSNLIGTDYLIPTLLATDNLDEIDFDSLPDNYIIKPNHTSGHWHIVTQGKADRKEIIKKCKAWLKRCYGKDKFEWHYSLIKPQIIIEPLLLDDRGKMPLDYKFQVLNGKWEWCYVSTPRNERFNIHGNYDTNWIKMAMYGRMGPCKHFVPKPKNLDLMVELAELLAEPFDYLRVDMYLINDRLYMGELTHFPSSGFFGFSPISFDFEAGKKLISYHR